MARFRQCQAKVKETSKTGTGTASVYKPIWFAYEKMALFLKNKDEPKKTINSLVSILFFYLYFTIQGLLIHVLCYVLTQIIELPY